MNIFNFLPTNDPIDANVQMRHFDISVNMPRIYSINELHLILDLIPNWNPNPYHQGFKVVRFLVRVDGEMFFGPEGSPNKDVPAHFQLADKDPEEASCLTAGNAFFNEKNELCLLNHKSGDFKPRFQTLQYAMAILLNSQIAIHPELKLQEMNRSGGVINEHSIAPEELEKLITMHELPIKADLRPLSSRGLFTASHDHRNFGLSCADPEDEDLEGDAENTHDRLFNT